MSKNRKPRPEPRKRGDKIPCPYCDGTGYNAQAHTECGFCDNGIHEVGK